MTSLREIDNAKRRAEIVSLWEHTTGQEWPTLANGEPFSVLLDSDINWGQQWSRDALMAAQAALAKAVQA